VNANGDGVRRVDGLYGGERVRRQKREQHDQSVARKSH
jgi:hypothetical protein